LGKLLFLMLLHLSLFPCIL